MDIKLIRNNPHPEALFFDLEETNAPFDFLSVHSPSQQSVDTCIDLLTSDFGLLAESSSERIEAGMYERVAKVPKQQTPLLKAYLFDRFNRANGGSDN